MKYIYNNMYSQNNVLNVDFQQPKNFIEKVITLQQQMPHILDDFKKYFVLYNKDPNYPEYQNMFENVKSNLTTLSSSLFMVSNEIDSNTDKISDVFNRLDILIKKEKKVNIMLKRRLGIVEQKANSSDEMIDNYSEIYDIGYLRNWGLFISIFVAGLCISKVFKQQNMNIN
jgi:hypothetical protein